MVVNLLPLNFHAPLSLWFCGDKKASWSIVVNLQNIFYSKMVKTCDNSTSMNCMNMFIDSVVIETIDSKPQTVSFTFTECNKATIQRNFLLQN